MWAEALVDTLPQMVAEFQANTLGDTFCPLEPEATDETLTDTCIGGFPRLITRHWAKTLYETLSNMKSETLVLVLHDMPGKDGEQTNY